MAGVPGFSDLYTFASVVVYREINSVEIVLTPLFDRCNAVYRI
jgi:hypothetical protein